MSISSILGFVLAGVVAKKSAESVQVAKPSEDRIAKLEARIAELEDDVARANLQHRRDQDLIDIWRERALTAFDAGHQPQQFPPGLRGAAVAMQHQAMQQAQALAQQSQLTQHNAIGLLGAQNLIDAELWCNCVPSRSQVWATSDPE